jgi:hypothetical protein
MWLKVIVLTLLGLATLIAAAVFYGASRWKSGTQVLRAKAQAARLPVLPATYDPSELDGLPPAVQRYFRAVLLDRQPVIASVSVRHKGQFSLDGKKWAPFTSNQMVITRRPGFDWDARIRMAPGMDVFVHDAYLAGEGVLHAALLGLVTVAQLRGTPDLAQGELMRFLAEAAWYPTALLPSQGVRWAAIDASSARASLTDGATKVTLDFRFDADGLISMVRSSARYRTVNGETIATPWQGRFWGYEFRSGMRVPRDGEVAWLLSEGPAPYWRGRIIDIDYEFAGSSSHFLARESTAPGQVE